MKYFTKLARIPLIDDVIAVSAHFGKPFATKSKGLAKDIAEAERKLGIKIKLNRNTIAEDIAEVKKVLGKKIK